MKALQTQHTHIHKIQQQQLQQTNKQKTLPAPYLSNRNYNNFSKWNQNLDTHLQIILLSKMCLYMSCNAMYKVW